MCASIKNPLQRDGTSQQQRLAKALLPENAKIEDRKIEEIIAFALEYSRLINYYNAGNTIQGDWSCFYDSDPCILFALLATVDTDSIEAEFNALQEKIQPPPAKTDCDPDPVVDRGQLPRYLDDIINLIYSVAIRIHEACKKLGDGNLLKEEIITIIKSDLHLAIIDNAQQDALIKLISYDKASIEPGNDYSDFINDNKSCACTKAWQLDQERYDCIFPDDTFNLASLKNLFYLFFVALLKIKRRAKIYFEECIEKNDSHQPHVTLFLAFFYLFQNAIDHLNSLTGSHLRHYLEKILCLHKKGETPDKVHVIFELAKNFDTHLVEEGVLLNAGKEDGRQMVYAMMEEIVVNKAKVEKVSSAYVMESLKGDDQITRVTAAPVANSADGNGEKFKKDEQPQWRPLGDGNMLVTPTGIAISSPQFILNEGDRLIILQLKTNQKDFLPLALTNANIAIEMSAGDEWHTVSPVVNLFSEIKKTGDLSTLPDISKLNDLGIDQSGFQVQNIPGDNFTGIEIAVFANPSAPPFKRLTAKSENYLSASWPVMKVRLNDIKLNSQIKTYDTFETIKFNELTISVIGQNIRNLVIQNDRAILDVSRDYQPFENVPYPGSSFYIGSHEVFQKRLNRVQLQLEWAGLPKIGGKVDFKNYYAKYFGFQTPGGSGTQDPNPISDNSYFTFTAQLLYNRKFIQIPGESTLFNDGDLSIIDFPKPSTPGTSDGAVIIAAGATDNNIYSFERDPGIPQFQQYDVTAQRGFIKLELLKDFFHDRYPMALTSIVASKNGGTLTPAELPNKPYTPTLKNISISYYSTETILLGSSNANTAIEEMFYITPFGYKKIAIDKNAPTIVPSFRDADEIAVSGTLFTQGNMYIGLKDAEPEQKVNILFQVLDGSGDNRYSPPDIEWDYLIDNEWKPFKPFEMQDHTRSDVSSKKSLLKSGIIEFILPKEISSRETTILDASFLWIRACAHEDPLLTDPDLVHTTQRIAALPDLVAIIAQAGIAEFQNNNNTLSHLAAPLPAKTISKFMDSRAAIKTVSQPYNSFDGRLPENNYQFYGRISERLRHKNRAICIWDYERLVLDKFPSLYKVKCLNHTNILQNKEIAPGFVSVSVIPDLRNRNAANKIEPRVPVGMLDEIKAFLKEKTNLFVAFPNEPDYLQVVNPLYEPVKISCCVRFYEGYDPAYYKYVLNTELRNFLAPWANNANSEISFGSVYHKSAILNFIEQRKYIDVVLGFKAEHFRDDLTPIPGNDADRISPTTSRSILTSYKYGDIEHEIEFIPYDESEPCPPCAIAPTA